MIGIIDYGAGNLDSVKKALNHIGATVKIIKSAAGLARVAGIVLPGVGSYGPAVNNLRASGMDRAVLEWLTKDRPFLGICLGMQLLFCSSPEDRSSRGLGFFQGSCRRFRARKVPQIGWNQIRATRRSRLLEGIPRDTFFYFLHSYYVRTNDQGIVAAMTYYEVDYPSVIERGNTCAVQFHPEKSGKAGIGLLRNWVEKC